MIALDGYIQANRDLERGKGRTLAEGWGAFHSATERREKVLLGAVYGEKALENLNFKLAATFYRELISLLVDQGLFTTYLIEAIMHYLESVIHLDIAFENENAYKKITTLYRANRDNIQIKLFFLWWQFRSEGKFKAYSHPAITYLNNIAIAFNKRQLLLTGQPISRRCPSVFYDTSPPEDETWAWLYHLQSYHQGMAVLNETNSPECALHFFENIPTETRIYPLVAVDTAYLKTRQHPSYKTPENLKDIEEKLLSLDLSLPNPWHLHGVYVLINTYFCAGSYPDIDRWIGILYNLHWPDKEEGMEYWSCHYLWVLSRLRRGETDAMKATLWLRDQGSRHFHCFREEMYVLRSYGILYARQDIASGEMEIAAIEQGFLKEELKLADIIIRSFHGLSARFTFEECRSEFEKARLTYLLPVLKDAQAFC